MPSGCRCHMMGRTCLAPAVHELSAGDRELGTHVGVTEGEDRSGLVLALCHYELEVAILILCDSQVQGLPEDRTVSDSRRLLCREIPLRSSW